jgi:putative NADPH-quinone reductase
MAKIAIIVGHPQQQTLCEALAEAYARGATAAGHEVKLFALSRMNFDPILRDGFRREHPLEPDLQAAYDWMAASDHWVIVFPLWCGDMPALMKGFIERILQPGLIHRQGTDQAMNWRIFPGKSARVVMTMGMPTLFYRFWYGANTLRLLKRNILHFIGIKPVRETLFGMVADVPTDKRLDWLKQMEALGTAAM